MTDRLSALDAAEAVVVSGISKVKHHFPDLADQARIMNAHDRGVTKAAIAKYLSEACGHYISPKAVASWIESQRHAG